MKTKRLTLMAVLLAMSLIIFVIEAQLPPPVSIPGIKIGLANVITLVSLCTLGKKEALLILTLRIILGSIFTGSGIAVLYSFSGGICCFFAEALLIKRFNGKSLWILSVFGAVAHNIGQLAAAAALTAAIVVFAYLPALVISGIISGAITGACAELVLNHNKEMIKKLLQK